MRFSSILQTIFLHFIFELNIPIKLRSKYFILSYHINFNILSNILRFNYRKKNAIKHCVYSHCWEIDENVDRSMIFFRRNNSKCKNMTFEDIKTKRSCYNRFENNFKSLIKSKEDVNIVIKRVSSTINEELKHTD